jgi:tRNA A-37 threonylcarbamoyl transferase component Bud32
MELPDPLTPQSLADGRYVLVEPIGSGGAAEVWKVRDTQLDVDRAVKILTPAGSERKTLRRRLRAEAKILARINHPHVLRVMDIGQEGQRDYIVMDLLTNGSIADRVTRDGPLSPGHAVTLTLEVLSALAAAHGQAVVHRDVKPQNILIAEDGRAVLADFGIALIEEGDRRTRTGVAMGSFAFMPPEQRIDAKRVGPTADIYATAASLYWMLTAKNPVDLFAAEAESQRFSALPPELAAAIAWATRYEPEDRPQSAAEFAARLRPLASADTQAREELDPSTFPLPAATFVTASGTPMPASTRAPTDASTAAQTWAGTDPGAVDAPARRRGGAWVAALIGVLGLAAVGSALLAAAALVFGNPLSAPQRVVVAVADDPGPSWSDHEGWPDPADTIPAPMVQAGTPLAVAVPRAPPRPPARLGASWTGSFNGRPARLTLVRSGANISGTWTVSLGTNDVVTAVAGTWDAASGILRLNDVEDTPDSGRYEARYSSGHLDGTFHSRHRDAVLSFTLRPEQPR